MAQINENRMDGLRSEVENITNTLESQNTGETARERLLNSARNIITVINFTPTIQGPRMLQKQFDLVDALQHLAYYDPDTGGVKDIAEWCVQRWLNLLQQYPESWQALKGEQWPSSLYTRCQFWRSRTQQPQMQVLVTRGC